MAHVLADHSLLNLTSVGSLAGGAGAAKARRSAWRCLASRAGFETGELAVIGEQDILGDRLVRPRRAAKGRTISSPK